VKGFKFKLQSVLEIREKKFEDSQFAFAKAKNKLHQENLIMANLIKTLKKTFLSLEEALKSGGIDQTIIFIHQNYILKLKENIKRQKKAIEAAEKELEEKNQLMLEALKEKKIMEKLRERALSDFKSKIEKQEMLLIDEIATCRHAKKA
jgi:flagellar protein FliJ